MKKYIIFAVIAILIAAVVVYAQLFHKQSPAENNNSKLINQVSYLCNEGKTIEAGFYEGVAVSQPQPGEPPIPTGSVSLVLSDGRKLTLAQTISASGIRYANSDESFVFWGKGNGAFVLEANNQTYAGCMAFVLDPGGLPQAFADGIKGFSIRYPVGFSVDASYKYQALGPGKDIAGIKFTIPTTMASGTNLSSFDTGVSVEEIPDAQDCNATLFVYPGVKAVNITDNNTEYSFVTTSDAGAGNFYEEKVWAMPGTNPCIAIRYFIHSTNIGNYTPGTVREFDRASLINQFDQMRRSLILN